MGERDLSKGGAQIGGARNGTGIDGGVGGVDREVALHLTGGDLGERVGEIGRTAIVENDFAVLIDHRGALADAGEAHGSEAIRHID